MAEIHPKHIFVFHLKLKGLECSFLENLSDAKKIHKAPLSQKTMNPKYENQD